jgi:hypothetical protein
MKAIVIIEKGADGTFDARIENEKLDYMVLGQGNTVNDTINDFYLSYKDMKDYYKERDKHFEEISEFEFKYDLPSFLQYYSTIFTFAALERLTGVNQTQLSQYVQGYRNPSKQTVKKIEVALHNFATELKEVQFA